VELLESSCVRPRQARYQAALRPDMKYVMIIKHFPTEILLHQHNLAFDVPEPNGISLACRWIFSRASLLHQQFHLRVAFEDLRVPLAKQLCHPLIGHAARTEASGIRGSQIVKPKVRNLRLSEGLLPNGLQLYLVPGRIQIAGE
jgi:hypothetical protein